MRKFQVSFAAENKGIAAPTMDAIMLISKVRMSFLTARAIDAHFDELCGTKTSFATLNQALKRLAKNKKELLLVLERPDIPLHNNLSERDIREYVIKRKISGSTRSENGRRCRDTFTSLFKTCKKTGYCGLGFYW